MSTALASCVGGLVLLATGCTDPQIEAKPPGVRTGGMQIESKERGQAAAATRGEKTEQNALVDQAFIDQLTKEAAT